MYKKMCEWKRKEFEEKLDKLRTIVSNAEYVCLKCGRVAAQSDRLCRPKTIKAKKD